MDPRVGLPQGLVDLALQGQCKRRQVGLTQVIDPALQGEVERDARRVGRHREQVPRNPGDRARGIGAQPLPLAGQVRSLKGRFFFFIGPLETLKSES